VEEQLQALPLPLLLSWLWLDWLSTYAVETGLLLLSIATRIHRSALDLKLSHQIPTYQLNNIKNHQDQALVRTTGGKYIQLQSHYSL
jgi:hypothetical protein